MTEENTSSAETTPPPSGGGADPNNPYGYPMEDVEEGKLFAILSYIIPLVFLVPLIQKDNHFSLFHAKQVLLLVLACVAVSVLTAVPILGCITFILFLPILVFVIMGLVFAIQGQYKPLPFLGQYAEEWFKGVQVEKK
jgi:uncharacterized membrane protein